MWKSFFTDDTQNYKRNTLYYNPTNNYIQTRTNNNEYVLNLLQNHSYDEIIKNIINKTISEEIIDELIKYGVNINGNIYKQSFIFRALQVKNPNYAFIIKLIQNNAKLDYQFTYFEDSLLYKLLKVKSHECECYGRCSCKQLPPENDQIRAVIYALMNNIQVNFKIDYTHKLSAYEFALQEKYPDFICEFIYNKTQNNKINIKSINKVITLYIDKILNEIYNNKSQKAFNKLLNLKGLSKDEKLFIVYYKIKIIDPNILPEFAEDIIKIFKNILFKFQLYQYNNIENNVSIISVNSKMLNLIKMFLRN